VIAVERSVRAFIWLSLLALPLASCANSGLGRSLQDSLAADPRLTQTAPETASSPSPSPPVQAELPANFPSEIPQYPNAILQDVVEPEEAQPNSEITTVWQTGDSRDRVAAFYREQLQTEGWKLQEAPLISQQGTLVAQRDTPNVLTVTILLPPATSTPAPNPTATATPEPIPTATGTQFTIRYTSATAISQASPSSPPQSSEVFLGAEGTSTASAPTPAASPVVTLPPNNYTDLNKAPQELQRYLADLAQLGVLNLSPASQTKTASTTFAPNKPVSRREYARWLFEANNRLFSDRPAQQIRSANGASQPAFRDVPPSDPDFAAIQGLAEAGIIPSSLSGNSAAVTFRPDAQLSRETMLLWKVPMDTRQPLPAANLDAVKQTWGFQDAARIDPIAQRAVLADFQNADLSNIRRVFGFTTLFQPKRAVTRAEAAATLWHFGYQGDGASAQDALKT
jgi:hypothetical protein